MLTYMVNILWLKTHYSLNSKSIIKPIWTLTWKRRFEGKLSGKNGESSVKSSHCRECMVWLLFIVFRHDFLKRKFLKLFVLVPTPFFVFDRNLSLFCLPQMNVKEKNTGWNTALLPMAYCLYAGTSLNPLAFRDWGNRGRPTSLLESSIFDYKLRWNYSLWLLDSATECSTVLKLCSLKAPIQQRQFPLQNTLFDYSFKDSLRFQVSSFFSIKNEMF